MPETGNNQSSIKRTIRFAADGFSFASPEGSATTSFDAQQNGWLRGMAHFCCNPLVAQTSKWDEVLIDSPYATIIPAAMDTIELREASLRYLFDIPDDFKITGNKLPGNQLDFIFALPNELMQFIKNELGERNLKHDHSLLVEQALAQSRQDEAPQLWAQQQHDKLVCVVANNGKLILYNQYPLLGDNDVAYYCFSLYDQFDMLRSTHKLYFKGSSSAKSLLEQSISNLYDYAYN